MAKLRAMPFPADTAYRAPAWLPGGHLQTIYTSLFIRVPPVAYRRERLELPDGDFLDIDWVDGQTGASEGSFPCPHEGDSDPLRTEVRVESYALKDSDPLRTEVRVESYAPVVVLFHGLEGSADSHYARNLMAHVRARGWHGAVAHFRGC